MISLDLRKLRDLRLELEWKHIWKNIYRLEYKLIGVKDKYVTMGPLDPSVYNFGDGRGVVAVYPDGSIERVEADDFGCMCFFAKLPEIQQKERDRLSSLSSLNPGVAIALSLIGRNVSDSEESLFPVQIKHEDAFTIASVPIWIKEKPSLPHITYWEYK